MLRELIATAALFAAVAVVFTWPLAARAGSAMTAQPFGDPLLNAWILAWGADRLRHGFAGFWDAPFFYPWPDTLAYSEHLAGITIFTAPVQWLTGNPVLAYNLALLGTSVLAGVGMYLLAREATGRMDAALVAAAAFACSPYRVPQLYHLQVLAWGWMPVALCGLHRYFAARAAAVDRSDAPRARRALVVFVAAFLLQALSNGYFLYFQAVPIAIVVFDGLVRTRARRRRIAGELAAAAAAIVGGLLPFVLAYLRVRREQGLTRSFGDVTQFSADLAAWGHVDSRLWLWGDLLPRGAVERELFPGLTIVLLAAAGFVAAWRSRGRVGEDAARRRRYAAVYGAVLIAGVLLVLGPHPAIFGWTLPLPGPYAWLMAIVPGFDGLRVPARLAVVVYLSLGVLGGIGAGALLVRLPARWRTGTAAGLVAAVAVEGYGGRLALDRFPTPDMAADRSAYEWLRTQRPGPMLELPVGDVRLGTRYLYRTLVHGNPIVNGYSGYGSILQDFAGGPPFVEPARFDEAFEMLRAIGVRWVLVHRALYADVRQGDEIARAAAAQGAHVSRAQDFGSVLVLELRPLAAPPAPGTPTEAAVPARSITAQASHAPERLPLAFDGHPGTRWLSGTPQGGGEWIALRFDQPRNLSRIRIEMDRRSLGDYPRGLVIEGSADGEHFAPLWEGNVLEALALSLVREPRTPAIDIGLPPNDTRVLRLRVTGEAPRWFWSVPELRVFSRPARGR